MKTNLSYKYIIDGFRSKLVLLILLSSISWTCNLQAQVSTATDFGDELWPVIETQLDQQQSDTAFFFIVQLIRNQCGNDFDCLYTTYSNVRRHIEVKFNLPAAVYLSYEMAEIAKKEKNLDAEGHAYLNLRRFYGAMRNEELQAVNAEKAQRIFEELDDQDMVSVLKMSKLEGELTYKEYQEVIPQMNALLAEMREKGEKRAVNSIHLRMIYICLDAKLYEEAEYHIDNVEKLAISNPMKEDEYGYAIPAALGRAEVAKANQNLVKAEAHYQRALKM